MRRSTVEHPFGTLKFWMGSAHFLMKTLHNVKTEMSLHVLSYNMKRVMNILGEPGLLQAMRAYAQKGSLLFIFACAAALISSLSAVFCARQARFQPGKAASRNVSLLSRTKTAISKALGRKRNFR